MNDYCDRDVCFGGLQIYLTSYPILQKFEFTK